MTGTGRLYRNVTIGELDEGEVARVTDYRGEPTATPEWRQGTGPLDMPVGGICQLRHSSVASDPWRLRVRH